MLREMFACTKLADFFVIVEREADALRILQQDSLAPRFTEKFADN
jgi:hypothetical protein